jgi:hypothetical protein
MKPPPHLDVSKLDPKPRITRLRNGIRRAVWRNTDKLDERSQDAIYETIVELCDITFRVDFSKYWERRRSMGFLSSLTNFTLLLSPDDDVIAFTSYQMCEFAGARTLYIDSTSVYPPYQTKGLMAPLFAIDFFGEHLRNPFRRMYMIVRTENPIVYAALCTMLGGDNMNPDPRRPVPERLQEIASACADWLKCGDAAVHTPPEATFDPERLTQRDAYSDPLYDRIPRSGLRPLDEFFHSSVRPIDAFLVTAPALWREIGPFFVRQSLTSARAGRQVPRWLRRRPDAPVPRRP